MSNFFVFSGNINKLKTIARFTENNFGFKIIYQKNNILILFSSDQRDLRFEERNASILISYNNKIALEIHYANSELVEFYRPWDSIRKILYSENKKLKVTLVTNDIKSFKLFHNKINFDREYFRKILIQNIPDHKTIFSNIFEILPGCNLVIDIKNSNNYYQYFSETFYDTNNIDFCSDESVLFQQIECNCKNLLENNEAIFLDFSGGLDSSMLLNIFKFHAAKHECNIFAINFYSNKFSEADERKYISTSIPDNKVKLIYVNHDNFLPFDDLDKFSHLPIAVTEELALYKRFKVINYFTQNFKKYCIINGEGGDNLFFSPPSIEILLDLVKTQKISTLFDKIKSFYSFFRLPIIAQIIFLLRFGNKQQFLTSILTTSNFDIMQKNKMSSLNTSNFYFDDMKEDELALTKFIHLSYIKISKLITNQDIRLNCQQSNFDLYHPILMSNVVSEALKLDGYKFYDKNYDRYIQRKYLSRFKNTNPWRTNKGDISSLVQLGFKKNFKKIREIVLDGYLIESKILNKAKTESLLNKLANFGIYPEYHLFLKILSIEITVNSWKSELNKL